MSLIPPSLKRAASNLTAQQWAWEFLRRNPDYRKAWNLMSSLSPIQTEQIGYLVAKRLYTLLHDSLIKFDVVCTLDLQFFDQNQLEDFEGFEGDGSLGAYREHNSKFDDFDPSSLPPVSDQFVLGTYCLKRWANPDQSFEADPTAAAELWVYEQYSEAGLEHVPHLELLLNFDKLTFRPATKSFRGGKKKVNTIQTAGPLVKCDNGSLLIRSPTLWDRDYKVPTLKVQEVDIRFDVTMPLSFQLKQAEAELKKHHELLSKAGFVNKSPKAADRSGIFQEYLHVLDSIDEGKTAMDLTRETKNLRMTVTGSAINARTGRRVVSKAFRDPQNENADHGKITDATRQKILRATRLRDYGYKALAFL